MLGAYSRSIDPIPNPMPVIMIMISGWILLCLVRL